MHSFGRSPNLGFLINSDRPPYHSESVRFFYISKWPFAFFLFVCLFIANLKKNVSDLVSNASVLSGASEQCVITAPMYFQPSPSTSSLSSTHSASPNVTSSAPSSARGQCQGVG